MVGMVVTISPSFKAAQDGGLSCGIQAHHQDAHLLLPNQALEKVSKDVTHDHSSLSRTAGCSGGQRQSGSGLDPGMEDLIYKQRNANSLPPSACQDFTLMGLASHGWSSYDKPRA